MYHFKFVHTAFLLCEADGRGLAYFRRSCRQSLIFANQDVVCLLVSSFDFETISTENHLLRRTVLALVVSAVSGKCCSLAFSRHIFEQRKQLT